MRGQLFSLDFVIAMAILTISIGITIQTMDTLQKRVQLVQETHTNHAEVIAQNLLSPAAGFQNVSPYCVHYSNGSSNCQAFNCNRYIFTATRLTTCINAGPTIQPCAMQVRACT